MLKKLLNNLDAAVAETNRIDDEWEKDPENKALEAEWNRAYKAEYEAHQAFTKALVDASQGRLTRENVRALYFTKHEELKNLIERMQTA